MASKNTKQQAASGAESDVASLLEHFGVDVESEHFAETPRRFVSYLTEFFQPFELSEVLGPRFTAESDSMIVQHNIPMQGTCPHHLLPFMGHCAIGYLPRKHLVGLSKLTRLVSAVTHEKPDLQETSCQRVADLLWEYIEPMGVIVTMKATHTCMAARGVRAPDVPTCTSALRGIFRDVPQARQEFFALIG
jgi:GTP cyclohydrolase IA